MNNTRKPWEKRRSRQGFTLAELLVVIAIIAILSGVVFIAVWTYQRSMGQLERDGIAKQIFIAAQNHLTAARGEGYLGLDKEKFGKPGDDPSDISGNYCFAVTNGSVSNDADEIYELMLPIGALEENILAGGSYLIRYNRDSGTVLDVFYCTTKGSPAQFNRTLSTNDYVDLLAVAGDDNKSARRNFTGGSILGWYGGAEGIEHGEPLSTPRIAKHNEEILWVDVTDDNKEGASLRLEVTGETSGAIVIFRLRVNGSNRPDKRIKWDENGVTCHVVLDDITTPGRHFSDINSDSYEIKGTFRPGENLILRAIAYNNTALTNDASSAKETTNSLFADGTNTTALISNFRHFENLDRSLSGFDNSSAAKSYQAIPNAEQTKDLIWYDEDGSFNGTRKPEDFVNAVKYIEVSQIKEKTAAQAGNALNVYVGNTPEAANCLHPVSLDYRLSYDGKSCQDSNVQVNAAGAAGLFGTVGNDGLTIKDLKLLDFTVAGTTNAGALAGAMNNSSVTNVLAYHSGSDMTPTITAAGGSAGGLIGSAGGTTVTKSAAALAVHNTAGAAGGLIGTMTGGTVTASFSGGHTQNAEYWNHNAAGERTDGIYNVRSDTGAAGGLIGSLSSGTVSGSYSTCSASGTKAGGFVGDGSGSISNCYCTGLVFGDTKGAFAGSLGGSVSNCRYFEIINEVKDDYQGYTCLSSVGGGTSNSGITAFDASAAAYSEFCGAPGTWKNAHAYDAALSTEGYYGGMYNLRTVERLGATVSKDDDFVYDHYGDWPAPEAFVINKGNSSGNQLGS